jgi:hypothetical protein
MKNKFLFLIILLSFTIGFTNCSKDCEPEIQACNETPPTNEACAANFKRWFYNKEKNRCVQIEYNGCSQNGFATHQECEECKCK